MLRAGFSKVFSAHTCRKDGEFWLKILFSYVCEKNLKKYMQHVEIIFSDASKLFCKQIKVVLIKNKAEDIFQMLISFI